MQFPFDANINKIAEKVKANERMIFDESVDVPVGTLNSVLKQAGLKD